MFVTLSFASLCSRVIEEIGFRAYGHCSTLMSVLITCLQDGDTTVKKQSIVSGTNLFRSVLEEMTLQVPLSAPLPPPNSQTERDTSKQLMIYMNTRCILFWKPPSLLLLGLGLFKFSDSLGLQWFKMRFLVLYWTNIFEWLRSRFCVFYCLSTPWYIRRFILYWIFLNLDGLL